MAYSDIVIATESEAAMSGTSRALDKEARGMENAIQLTGAK